MEKGELSWPVQHLVTFSRSLPGENPTERHWVSSWTGLSAGLPLSEEDIQKYLDRRKPGTGAITTQRKEADQVEILSGVFDGKTTGTPISLMVRNTSRSPQITARLQRITVPAMQITALMPNTVFGIIGVVAVLPVVRPSGVWRPELLLQRFWNRWVLPYSPIPVPSAPSMRILQNITGTLPAPPLLPCRSAEADEKACAYLHQARRKLRFRWWLHGMPRGRSSRRNRRPGL